MPNWCTNTLVIQGDPEEMEQLVRIVEGDSHPFSLNSVIKMPQELKDQSSPVRDEVVGKSNLEKYGAKDWYDWAITNWDTKWDVDARIVSDITSPMLPGLRTITYEFDSAWNPPLKVYDVLAARFPNTNIYACWDEPGCDFSGYRMYRNGELVKQVDEEPSYSNRQLNYNPTEEIFDYFPSEGEVEKLRKQAEERRMADLNVKTALLNMQNLINNL
jgi:hypothetical protein